MSKKKLIESGLLRKVNDQVLKNYTALPDQNFKLNTLFVYDSGKFELTFSDEFGSRSHLGSKSGFIKLSALEFLYVSGVYIKHIMIRI